MPAGRLSNPFGSSHLIWFHLSDPVLENSGRVGFLRDSLVVPWEPKEGSYGAFLRKREVWGLPAEAAVQACSPVGGNPGIWTFFFSFLDSRLRGNDTSQRASLRSQAFCAATGSGEVLHSAKLNVSTYPPEAMTTIGGVRADFLPPIS